MSLGYFNISGLVSSRGDMSDDDVVGTRAGEAEDKALLLAHTSGRGLRDASVLACVKLDLPNLGRP